MQIGVITNPNSRKNRGRPDRAAQLQSIVGNLGEVHETRSVESIKPILREFLRKRARYWVADGGDGALHWMFRMGMEVLEEDEFQNSDVTMPLTLPTNGGTIDFIAQNVGITGTAESLLSTLRRNIEARSHIEEVEVDSMLIEGVEVTDSGDESFRTYGFGIAAGGVGQRFMCKYYEHEDPNPRTIVEVFAKTFRSMPIAFSPLRHIPGMPKYLSDYAREVFEPTPCRMTIDGMVLPDTSFSGIHIASMSINFHNVLQFFKKADEPGLLNCIVGTMSPMAMIRNIPRMHRGKEIRDKKVIDRACREMTMEALPGQELLAPIIDGEHYDKLRKVSFKLGPRVRIPKLVSGYRA